MPVTEVIGNKLIQINLGETGGDYVMSKPAVIREIRLTGIGIDDYMTFYEAAGSNPKICKLDYDRPATFFQGTVKTKIGFNWSECSVQNPAAAILSIECEKFD